MQMSNSLSNSYSPAVLVAEILSLHMPKLVNLHNYSYALGAIYTLTILCYTTSAFYTLELFCAAMFHCCSCSKSGCPCALFHPQKPAIC